MVFTPVITATVNGSVVSRDTVQRWEARRATAVLTKLFSRIGGLALAEIAPDINPTWVLGADLRTQKAALLTIKTGLGHAGIYALLRREIMISQRLSRAAVTASCGRTTHSIIAVSAPGVDAERFATWFNNLTALNDEPTMVDAIADHYLLRGLPDGRQEVVETVGNSPLATRFLVDYTASDRLQVRADPDYPIQITGHAVHDDGLVIGGVRHQIRDCDGTLEALPTAEFPALTPPSMVAAHRWHLAVEFSNWIEAFARTEHRRQS